MFVLNESDANMTQSTVSALAAFMIRI